MNAETLEAFAARALVKVGRFEYAGPCPLCGGSDRFHVSFKKSPQGFAHCRQGCTGGQWWSGPWFTSQVYGISYPDARRLYGLEVGQAGPRKSEAERQAERAKALEDALSLCQQNWSGPAAQVLARFQQGLYSGKAKAYLRDKRHLSGKTCVELGFGYCVQFETVPGWGGAEGAYFFPAGVVMPVMRGGSVVGMVIRREKAWRAPDGREVRYRDVFGASKVPFICGPSGGLVVVVEGIFDAASIYQASRGKFGVVAVCGNDIPLDAAARDMLTAAKVVLIAVDADAAGVELAKLIHGIRPSATVVSVPDGKDANGYLAAHGDEALARWLLDMARRALEIEKGAAKPCPVPEPQKAVAPEARQSIREKVETILAPLLSPQARTRIVADESPKLDGMLPIADITSPESVKSVRYSSPLDCVLSFYAGVRLLAYPDGRLVIRDPQGRKGLEQYVRAYQKAIWEGLTKGKAA